jgi:hypothetical protein
MVIQTCWLRLRHLATINLGWKTKVQLRNKMMLLPLSERAKPSCRGAFVNSRCKVGFKYLEFVSLKGVPSCQLRKGRSFCCFDYYPQIQAP